jgi:hypothetical protein
MRLVFHASQLARTQPLPEAIEGCTTLPGWLWLGRLWPWSKSGDLVLLPWGPRNRCSLTKLMEEMHQGAPIREIPWSLVVAHTSPYAKGS